MRNHTALYFLFRVGSGLASLASLALLTRLLTPEQYGGYALGVSFMSACAAIFFQWVNIALGRNYPNAAYSKIEVIKTAHVCLAAAASILLSASCLGLTLGLSPKGYSWTFAMLLVIGAMAQGLYALHAQILNSASLPIRFGVLALLKTSLAAALAIAAAYLGGNLNVILFGVVMGTMASLLIAGHWHVLLAHQPLTDIKQKSLQFARFGIPLSLNFVAVALVDTADRFILAYHHGTPAVGAYAAAFEFTQLTLGATLSVLYTAAYPKIVALWESNEKRQATHAIARLQCLVILTAGCACTAFISLRHEIAHSLFPQWANNDAAVNTLPLICIAVALNGIRAFLVDIPLHLHKASAKHLFSLACMAMANLGLNLLLIPSYGPVGAALATAIGFAISLILSARVGIQTGLLKNVYKDIIQCALCVFIALMLNYLIGQAIDRDRSPLEWHQSTLEVIGNIFTFSLAAFLLNTANIRSVLGVISWKSLFSKNQSFTQ
jgi:O-antigen/teichoic acid export membrane protein